jgi:hypothetical protein
MLITKKPSKINFVNAAGLIIFGLIVDIIGALIGWIPGISLLISVIGWSIVNLWLTLLGIGFMNGRRIGTMFTSMIVEAVPVLNILPGFTVAIIAIIIMVKSEEKLGIKLPKVGVTK